MEGSTSEIRELLADFGEVMLEVQLFEFALAALIDAQETGAPAEPGSEARGRHIEALFSSTGGQLAQRARIEDPDFAEQVKQTVQLRNQLAHGWLIRSSLAVVSGRSTHQDERDALQLAARSIRGIRVPLEELLHAALLDRGLDPHKFSPEEVAILYRQQE